MSVITMRTSVVLLATIIASVLFFGQTTHAQTEGVDELRATIKAGIMADPRSQGLSQEQVQAMVNALSAVGNVNPVHMGVVLIATLAFGLITPPYGLVLLMASKFVGVRFSQALRASLPIYIVFLTTIAFTIYFPSVVLWLPQTMR